MARWGDHAYRLKGNVIPAGNPVHMNPEDIMRRLEILREEHRDLDTAIMALIDSGGRDQLQLARLKRSEEHTSELQSLMSISYAVFCLKKKQSQYTTRDK